jgi:hypothetical protein
MDRRSCHRPGYFTVTNGSSQGASRASTPDDWPILASSIITRTCTGSSTTPTQTCAIGNGTPSRRWPWARRPTRCRANRMLNSLETDDQDIDMSAKGPDDPAFAFGSTVRLRWYDVRRGCWKDTGTTSFIAGPANHVTRPGNPTPGSDRWVAVMRKDNPVWDPVRHVFRRAQAPVTGPPSPARWPIPSGSVSGVGDPG